MRIVVRNKGIIIVKLLWRAVEIGVIRKVKKKK